jgi:tyrosinase
VTVPFSYTGATTLDTGNFGYTYAEAEVASQDALSADATLPGIGFLSLPAPKGPFKHAMLEIQGLRKTEQSYTADFLLGRHSTVPADPYGRPEFAARFSLFGHGDCVGGPGHCSSKPRLPFDLRPPHHLAPYDTYQVITDPLRAYLGQNPGTVDLTVVLRQADNEPAPIDTLKFVGVSIVTHE